MANHMNPKVDFYFAKADKWKKELETLRTIILECNLPEELKWGVPCYTYGGKNVVLIHAFKEYCAVLFMKGALMKDPKKILIQQTENVQAGRQIRFTTLKEIEKNAKAIQAYVYEAVKIEESGVKVPLKKATEFAMPEEFATVLKKKAALKKAFYALTPGRQRAYLLFFAGAKQSATRAARVEKYEKAILDGKGLND